MAEDYYIRAQEISEILYVGEGTGYKIIRELNKELMEKGFRIVRARVPRKYFKERYGIDYEGHW